MNGAAPSRREELLKSPLTWHYVGLGVLIVLVIGLAIRFGMDWAATDSNSADALAAKQVQLKMLDRQTQPLRGLDKRVAESREQMKDFYAKRIPATYSAIMTHLGAVEIKSGVRLSRVLYSQALPTGDLSEISLDAGVTGTYPQIMQFVNGLERDSNFFVIRAMALTGTQGGMVNLRLRVSTWMRASDAANSGIPQAQDVQNGNPSGNATAPAKEEE